MNVVFFHSFPFINFITENCVDSHEIKHLPFLLRTRFHLRVYVIRLPHTDTCHRVIHLGVTRRRTSVLSEWNWGKEREARRTQTLERGKQTPTRPLVPLPLQGQPCSFCSRRRTKKVTCLARDEGRGEPSDSSSPLRTRWPAAARHVTAALAPSVPRELLSPGACGGLTFPHSHRLQHSGHLNGEQGPA